MLEPAPDDLDLETIASRLEVIAVRLHQLADDRADAILIGSAIERPSRPDAADEYADLLARQAALQARLVQRVSRP